MISPTNLAITFGAFFTTSKQGKTGLTVTIDVYRDGTAVVTAGSATETGGGHYRYQLAAGSTATAGAYVAVFKTADTTVDQQHVPAMWVVGQGLASGLSATADGSGGLPTLQSLDRITRERSAST